MIKFSQHYIGIEVGYGWLLSVNDMLTEIGKLDEIVTIVQIKEKFGTLRIYTTGHSEKVHSIIEKYEKILGTTCERCGAEGIRVGSLCRSVSCSKCSTHESMEELNDIGVN